MSRTDAEILDRAEVDDLDAILAISNTDRDEVIHVVDDNADAIFTWDYEKGARPPLAQALREGQALAVERRDRPGLVDRGGPGAIARESPMTLNTELLDRARDRPDR